MSKILVIGENEELKRRVESGWSGRRSPLTVALQGWRAVKKRPPSRSEADVLVVDLTAPEAYKARGLLGLQRRNALMLFVLAANMEVGQSDAMNRLLELPTVDFVRPGADAAEVRHRIQRLLRQYTTSAKPFNTAATASPRTLVQELHDPATGRLDARRIAEVFGISLADTARSLGFSLSRLHKTPAAAAAQPGLYVFERVGYALLALVGSWQAARAWLNLPEDALAGKTPIEVITEGRGALVADMLDDMMIGQPA